MTSPVRLPLASEHTNVTTRATSSGVLSRPLGLRAASPASRSGADPGPDLVGQREAGSDRVDEHAVRAGVPCEPAHESVQPRFRGAVELGAACALGRVIGREQRDAAPAPRAHAR